MMNKDKNVIDFSSDFEKRLKAIEEKWRRKKLKKSTPVSEEEVEDYRRRMRELNARLEKELLNDKKLLKECENLGKEIRQSYKEDLKLNKFVKIALQRSKHFHKKINENLQKASFHISNIAWMEKHGGEKLD